jgi:hypothetical protein
MRNLPKIETVEQAREVLIEMDVEQEITAELDEWKASIKKHNDQEFSISFADYETGIINLWNASTYWWSTATTTCTSVECELPEKIL